nr:amino acid-binding protein [Actinomycetota bacterium]NIS35819.1 amino acid-binding protein [Actinomycetota bacterium]NIT98367.1 amino acid-binding protein [Actinomycetota bacterium]NIU21984.1 amino acid-binding protein [Actinomycetota bacterium]NIU70447.1 amino acid-binding protein [Actinomycetota bacterium]
VSREREVVVVQAEDRPGELAELAQRVGAAGVNLDLVYVATGSRVVMGSDDLEGLREALEGVAG